jgi:hypothetical protein
LQASHAAVTHTAARRFGKREGMAWEPTRARTAWEGRVDVPGAAVHGSDGHGDGLDEHVLAEVRTFL